MAIVIKIIIAVITIATTPISSINSTTSSSIIQTPPKLSHLQRERFNKNQNILNKTSDYSKLQIWFKPPFIFTILILCEITLEINTGMGQHQFSPQNINMKNYKYEISVLKCFGFTKFDQHSPKFFNNNWSMLEYNKYIDNIIKEIC
ncbi:hypothetical protein ACTFIU_001885 [Dictyostelium citrinum]